jgi:hypothetical protein
MKHSTADRKGIFSLSSAAARHPRLLGPQGTHYPFLYQVRSDFMWKVHKGLYFVLIIPALTSIALLLAGILTSPDELTDEGYSLKSIFFIVSAVFLFFPIASAAGMTVYYKRINDRTTHLVQNGIRGIAEILGREQTGIYINDLPQIQFLLKIILPDGKTFETQFKDIVNLLDLNSIQTGTRLPVFIDRENDRNIMLIYDKTLKTDHSLPE